MATSGFIVYGVEGALTRAKLSWTISSSSVESNFSRVIWTYERYHKTDASSGGYPGTVDIVIDGNTMIAEYQNVGLKKGWQVIDTGTIDIYHDIDGTKTFEYSFIDYTIPIVDGRYGSASGTGTLDAISRAPAILSASNFTDEGNPTIKYNNVAGEDMTALEACIANSTGTEIYVPYRAIDKTGSIYKFNLTIAERNALRAAAGDNDLAVRFYIRYTIGTLTDWVFVDRTMTQEDIAPTLNPTVMEMDMAVAELTGNNNTYILGYSDVRAATGATAPAGKSIASQYVRCGARSNSSGIGVFKDITTNVFEFYAMDSNGNTVTDRIDVDLVPYIPVTIKQTVRMDLDGAIVMTVEGNYFNGSFGAVNNTLKVESRTRLSGGEWNDWGDITVLVSDASGGTYYLTATLSGFNPNGSYEFQARVSDKLSSAESAVETVILKPIFDWGKYDFNFNVPLTIEGYALDDYVIETGTEAMGTNGTWYWRKWKSGRAECYGCRNYGNMAVTTAWGNLFRSEAFTQSLPTGLFVDTPEVIDITFRGGSNVGGWIVNHENSAPSKDETGSFILVRPAAATLTGSYLSFNIIGRWK